VAVRALLHYARDPWGSWAEYYHDLDHIPEHAAWEPRDFPSEDALYRWGLRSPWTSGRTGSWPEPGPAGPRRQSVISG